MTTSISIIAGAGISTAVSGGTIDDFADSFVMGTATGAISGAIAASPVGMAGQVIANAALGATNHVGTQHMSGKDVTLGGIAFNALAGATCAAFGGNGWLHQSSYQMRTIPELSKNGFKNVLSVAKNSDVLKLALPPMFIGGGGGGLYDLFTQKPNTDKIPLGF